MELEKSGAQLIKKDRQVSTSLTLNQRLSLDQTGWFFSRDRSRIYFLFFFFSSNLELGERRGERDELGGYWRIFYFQLVGEENAILSFFQQNSVSNSKDFCLPRIRRDYRLNNVS